MLRRINFLTSADIPEMVLTTAHFNLILKKISCRGGTIKEISKNNDEVVYEIRAPANIKPYEYLRTIWKENEEMINESINAIILALPPKDLASMMSKLLNKEINHPLSLVKLEWDREILSVCGDPDIILCDDSEQHIILIELKIQAKKTNGKYSLQQHIKYSNLVQRLQSHGKTVEVALLAPSEDFSGTLEKKEINWFNSSDNNVIPVPENVDGTVFKSYDYKGYLNKQQEDITKYELDICPNKFSTIKYISFSQFKTALNDVAPHLVKSFSVIEDYSTM